MKPRALLQTELILASAALLLLLPIALQAQGTNGPLVALGFTNTPIGSTTLEVIEGGVLFVHDTSDPGDGVSVALGEADSGVFLYPLTGYLYGGEALEGKAYGQVNGQPDQIISSIYGIHNGNGSSSGTVTVDFSPLGATRLSVYVGTMLVGQINGSSVDVVVYGSGYGCRANPWWRLPDGSFGALIEVGQDANITIASLGSELNNSSFFIRPDDQTNNVAFVSRVDVTASNLGSFCLTDARLGMFYQRHKALGTAILHPESGRLHVGNLVSNIQDGVLVELPGASSFEADFEPIELPGTNTTILISGYGTSGGMMGTGLGTIRIENQKSFIQIGTETGLSPLDVIILSNSVEMGRSSSLTSDAIVDLSSDSRISGCALLARTMETPPGFAVRVDRLTTFTNSDGSTYQGDEVRMLFVNDAAFETLESIVLVAIGLPTFTIAGERVSLPSPPALTIVRSENSVTVSWDDPNRVYFLEAAVSPAEGFEAVQTETQIENNVCHVGLNIEAGASWFFRLQRHRYSPD